MLQCESTAYSIDIPAPHHGDREVVVKLQSLAGVVSVVVVMEVRLSMALRECRGKSRIRRPKVKCLRNPFSEFPEESCPWSPGRHAKTTITAHPTILNRRIVTMTLE